MNDDFKKLYDRRQKREERRHVYKPVITIIALAAVVGTGLLGAWADKHYNTTAYVEMYAFLLACVYAIVFGCFRR